MRGGAELSKGFFCLMQTQELSWPRSFEGWKKKKKMPGPQQWLKGSWLLRVENGCGIFFPCDGLSSGSFCACSRQAAILQKCCDSRGVPKEQLVLERWVSVGFGEHLGLGGDRQGCFRVESSLSHGW